MFGGMLLLAGCGSGSGTGPLSGEIQGHPWMFVSGAATLTSPDLFLVALYPVPANASKDVYSVSLDNLPAATGVHELDATFSASFSAGDNITSTAAAR